MDAYNTYVRPNLECAQAFLWSPHTSPHAPMPLRTSANQLEAQPATASSLRICDVRGDV